MIKFLPLLVGALVMPIARAQLANTPAEAKLPTFEVATIKPSATKDGSWYLQPTPNGYNAMDISLLKLIGQAYEIWDTKFITGGPAWIDRDKFDLEAKFNADEIPDAKNLDSHQRDAMLIPLLADRFHLKVHEETKVFPVYDLVLATGGPKLDKTKDDDVTQTMVGASCLFQQSRRGYVKVQGCRVKDLEGQLRYATGRTVIDETGLTARYSFELRWTPENTPADSPEATAPSIFTAVQEQLGLKLKPATAPLKVLVIDSAEKPSEN